jgi:hypothetical protein
MTSKKKEMKRYVDYFALGRSITSIGLLVRGPNERA